jgi:hypothetical protein
MAHQSKVTAVTTVPLGVAASMFHIGQAKAQDAWIVRPLEGLMDRAVDGVAAGQHNELIRVRVNGKRGLHDEQKVVTHHCLPVVPMARIPTMSLHRAYAFG